MNNKNINTIKEVLAKRHSHYALSPEWVAPKEDVIEILSDTLNLIPSHFNSQTVRIVLLTGENHKKHWEIIENALIKAIGKERYEVQTKAKIHNAFLSGIGTVLFFDDTKTTQNLQEQFPMYASNFPIWAQQVQGSHQLAVWTGLNELGFGVNLQHYIGMVDDEIKKLVQAPLEWNLIAQMPFGKPMSTPEDKGKLPISDVLKIY